MRCKFVCLRLMLRLREMEDSLSRSTLLSSSAAVNMSRGELSMRLFAAVTEVDRLDHLLSTALGSADRVEIQLLKEEWTQKIETLGRTLSRITPAMPKSSVLEVPQLRLPQGNLAASSSGTLVSGRRGSAVHFSTTNNGSLPSSRPTSSRRGPKTHIDADLRAIGILRPIPLVRQLPLSVIRRMKLWARAAKYNIRERKANALYEKRLFRQSSVHMFAVLKAFYAASRMDRRVLLHRILRGWRTNVQVRLVRCERAAALLKRTQQQCRARRLLYGWRYFAIMCGTIRGAKVATNQVALLMLSDGCRLLDPSEGASTSTTGANQTVNESTIKRKWRRSLEMLTAASHKPRETTRKDRWEWFKLYLMRPQTDNLPTDRNSCATWPRHLLLHPPPQFDAEHCSIQSLSHCFEVRLTQLQRRLCLQGAWHMLRGYTRRRQAKKALRAQSSLHLERCQVRHAWWQWKSRLIVATAMRRLCQRALHSVFTAWRGVAIRRKSAGLAILRATEGKNNAAKASCFAKWQRKVPRALELSSCYLSTVHDGLRAPGFSFLYELLWRWSAARDIEHIDVGITNNDTAPRHVEPQHSAMNPTEIVSTEAAMLSAAIALRRQHEQPDAVAQSHSMDDHVVVALTEESYSLDTQWLRCRSIRGKLFMMWRQFTLWHKSFESIIGFSAQKYPDSIATRPVLLPLANVWRKHAISFLKRVVDSVWIGQPLKDCEMWCTCQREALEKRSAELRAQRGFRSPPGDEEVTLATALFFARDTTNVEKLLRYAGLLPPAEGGAVSDESFAECRRDSRHRLKQFQVQLYYWMGKLEEFYVDVMQVKCLGPLVTNFVELDEVDDSPHTDGEQGGELDDDDDDDVDEPQSPTRMTTDGTISAAQVPEVPEEESYGSLLMKSRQWEIKVIGRLTCRLAARRYASNGGAHLSSTRLMGYTPTKVLINFYKLFVKKKGRRRKKRKKEGATKKGEKVVPAPPAAASVPPESKVTYFSSNSDASAPSPGAHGNATAPSSLIPKFSGEDVIAITTLGVMSAPSMRTVDITRSPSPMEGGDALVPPLVEHTCQQPFEVLDDGPLRANDTHNRDGNVDTAIDVEVQRAAALAMHSPRFEVEVTLTQKIISNPPEVSTEFEISEAPCSHEPAINVPHTLTDIDDELEVEPNVAGIPFEESDNCTSTKDDCVHDDCVRDDCVQDGCVQDGCVQDDCVAHVIPLDEYAASFPPDSGNAVDATMMPPEDHADDIDISALPKSVRSLQMFAWAKTTVRAEPPARALNNLLFGATDVCGDFHMKGLAGQSLRRKTKSNGQKFKLSKEL